MKKVFLLLSIIATFITTGLFAETVTFAIGDYEPYTSENNPTYKLAEKIVTEAFALEGIVVKYEYYPWSRSYKLSEKGTFLGTFPWGRTKERESSFIMPKEAIFTSYEAFFYNPEVLKNFDWEEFSDLEKYIIGGSSEYEHVDLLKKNGLEVEVVSDESFNFKKLIAERIDLYPTNPKVASTILDSLGIEKLKFHPKKFLFQDQVILISNKRPNAQSLADAFDRGIRKLKASGRYAEIMGE